MSKIIDESTIKKFMIFCEFSVNLVNDRVLRSSKVAQWVVDHNNYDFRYNDNEPVVIFSSPTKLSCFSKGIPVNVINTQGSYYPLENEWIGEGGVINWEVQGIDKDSIFTKLSDYNVDTRKSNVIADSVLFYNKGVLLNPIFGKLIHKGAYSKQIQKYPQFTSYSKHILLKEIFPNV